MDNETMIQYFEWYIPNDGLWWKRCKEHAKRLSELGFTQIWLPPAYKGQSSADVGYGVYDMYDLGEFDQKGTVRTKYGTAKEYKEAVRALQKAGLTVYADIVLNHRMGADETETVEAVQYADNDRNRAVSDTHEITAWTKFTFPGRNGKYSKFQWNHENFSGTDWNEANGQKGIYCFSDKNWNGGTDNENGNFDYLMGVDLDTDNPATLQETEDWGKWYYDEIGMDGVRLDAVKHIDVAFYEKWLKEMRQHTGKAFPAVGEFWSADLGKLTWYLDSVKEEMQLFDVPLHFNFYNASSSGGQFSMRDIIANSLVSVRPEQAVTFVDNHDTEPGQSLTSYVQGWFKPLAYALILLREGGTPCVFYGDLYGIPSQNLGVIPGLKKLLMIRKNYAYGEQHDYLDDDNLIGWVRRGDKEHENSGIAVVMSDADGGSKHMEMGRQFAGQIFHDALGKCMETVTVGEDGWADFGTAGGNVAVWVTKGAYDTITIEA